MSANKTANPTNVGSKTNSSLVLKLNAEMIGRLISGFLAINFLIILIGVIIIFWKVDDGAYTIINTSVTNVNNDQQIYYNINNYQILKTEELSTPKGLIFPESIQKYFPLKIEKASRSIYIDKMVKEMDFQERLNQIKYSIVTNVNDANYKIIYSLGSELKMFLILLSIILLYELVIIYGSIRKGAKNIRRALKPLTDLAETAKNLNSEVSSIGLKSEGRYIKDLEGAINSIDANKLDSHISVDSSQKELKDLTSAINGMLTRISDSYQSQIRFVSDASHELRTPISVIQGYANLLDRWGKNDEKTMQESIDAIKVESESMKGLVEQLLFLARGDNESIQFYKEVIDVCEIVEDIVKETQMIDSNHNFELKLNRPACINGDKQLIKQVIRILVDNSIKYTSSGEKIILRVASKDDLVHITVQDSGIGIEPEDLVHIFDRFYRSDDSRARKTGGSGLGLSIAKWIVEQHNGYFEILSRVDIGTRISILIPEAIDKELKQST